ncbi:MAG: restriction endonuclease subunit S [Clostridia bacterium]|nr:restriction endonuclease subunit S [Clostridia bacterium]
MSNVQGAMSNSRPLKDSGVEWIGEIPEEWKIVRIKNLADTTQENAFIDGDWIESPDISDAGIRYLTTGNVGDGVFKRQGNGYISGETFIRLNCKYAYPNDFIIARLNAPYGRACILPSDEEKYVLAVDIVILRTLEDKRFLCYLSQCAGYQKSVEDEAKGTTMKRISRTNLGRIYMPIAPIHEQRRIADFLDRRCAEIDGVIEATKKTIEEYKALKQSIITEAVTKGVRGARPMKDSGIEWIGEIPEEWECKPIKYLVSYNDEVIAENTDLDFEFDYIEIGSVEYGKGITEMQHLFFKDAPSRARRIVQANDIIVSTVRTYLKAVAAVTERETPLIASTGFVVIRPQAVNPIFLKYAILSDAIISSIEAHSTGISYPAINASQVVQFKIPLPKSEEQLLIAEYLDEKCGEVDRLIDIKQQLLTELETYKKSVIYEYVTGKRLVV